MDNSEERNRDAVEQTSLYSGAMESLAGSRELSSLGSDSELNGYAGDLKTNRYGFVGGAQQADDCPDEVPVDVLRQRELKWLEMFSNWDKWMAKRHKKIQLRCQKGIPPSVRGRAWQYLSGSKVKMEQNKGKFEELDSLPGDPKWVDIIERDLHRQFPFHEMFISKEGHGQKDLFRVLKAYTLHRPEEGYCQAQAPIAAVLLMHMPAEDAFWCLVQICEKYLPGYYSTGLEAIQLDGEILFSLLRKVSPVAHRHLSKYKIDPILYMTEWFMCAFSRTLPWSSVLRVWDIFFCEGVKTIFRVALVLLKHMLGSAEKLKTCQGEYETIDKLKTIDPKYMQEGFLIQEIIELPIAEREIEKEHLIQLKKWRETHGELLCRPAPRMHGAKPISDSEPHKKIQISPSIILPKVDNIEKKKQNKESKPFQKEMEKQRLKEQKEKSKKKKQSAGKSDTTANGVVKTETGSQYPVISSGASEAPLLQNEQIWQSTESLSSEPSEQDTYL
ncbi:TBC1 domain family member 10A [Protopterus annectens]|uniref:TBC1 domain family member 10A n=1 Tax=Protopterus annectens TaxID=7888 RepID=UPI001CFBCD2A|nr:TBC1 domain family member 10A [Protopterus annectens]